MVAVRMKYPTKMQLLLVVFSVGVNAVIVAIWGYFYVYYPTVLTPEVHVLMAWLLTSTAIGMAALSVELYRFLLNVMIRPQIAPT